MKSLVSIIIPCYNQAQYLSEALQSVLDQTYNHWECIIVNDGSPDDTEQVAQEWLIKDVRFKYFYKENGGLSSARNAGLKMVKGNYIQFLDSDDVLDSKKLELSLAKLSLADDKKIKVVISNFRKFIYDISLSFDPYCDLDESQFNFESLLYNWDESFTIPIHCGFFETSLFKEFRFPEKLKAKEDWIMWVSLFHRDCKAVFIDEPLAFYRQNSQSMTMTKDMLPDFISAYEYFKDIVSEDEFDRLSKVLISRYYNSSSETKKKVRLVKASNSYQTGLLIKKGLRSFGLLSLSRKLFPIILKLKSK